VDGAVIYSHLAPLNGEKGPILLESNKWWGEPDPGMPLHRPRSLHAGRNAETLQYAREPTLPCWTRMGVLTTGIAPPRPSKDQARGRQNRCEFVDGPINVTVTLQ
jgi:hypothetical protein